MQATAPDTNYHPNALYDTGPNTAGCGRITSPPTAAAAGVTADGVVTGSEIRTGLSAAGVPRNNCGPHVAGAPRSNYDAASTFPYVAPVEPGLT